MERKIDIKKSILKLIISMIIIVGILGIIYLILDYFNLTSLTKEQLQKQIASFGSLGPIIFIVVSFLQVSFIPIPGSITILAGNYLFGPWLSYLYSFIGMFLGSLFAFFLGRVIGKRYVNWIVGDKQTVDYYLKKLKGKESVVLFFMFLLPMFPDDILCSITGIMPISWSLFVFMQIITRITSIGATLFLMSGEIIPYEGWGLVVLIVLSILCIIVFVVAFKNAEKINEKLIAFIDKLFFKKKKEKLSNDKKK